MTSINYIYFSLLGLCMLFFALILPFMPHSHHSSKAAVTQTRMTTVYAALLAYENDYGVFPPGKPSAAIKALYAPEEKQLICGHANLYMEITPPQRDIFGFNAYSPSLDANGNYLDAWGTPFTIKISDKDGIEIESFGPNLKDDKGKGDDLILRRNSEK